MRLALDEIESLLPADSFSTDGVLGALFSGLFEVDGEGQLQPLVAAALPTTDDAITWIIKIAPGWTFEGGEEITARSFVDAWNFAAQDAQWSYFSFSKVLGFYDLANESAESVSGFVVIDKSTISITLEAADSSFPYALLDASFLPMARPCLTDPETCRSQPISNGPYRVAAPWRQGERLILERNEEWGGGRTPEIGRYEIVFDATGPTGVDLVASGDLDLIALGRGTGVPDETPARVVTVASGSVQYLGLPTSDERFADVDVRTAIGMAIDRQAVIDVAYGGAGVPLDGLVPPMTAGYQAGACGRVCTYDPAAARVLLDEAGGLGGDPVTLTFTGDAADAVAFREVADQLERNLGVQVEVEQVDGPFSPIGRSDPGPWELGWSVTVPTSHEYLSPWAGESGREMPYENGEVVELYAAAVKATTPGAALDLLAQAERVVLAEVGFLPLWASASQYLVGERMLEVPLDGLGRLELAELTLA